MDFRVAGHAKDFELGSSKDMMPRQTVRLRRTSLVGLDLRMAPRPCITIELART